MVQNLQLVVSHLVSICIALFEKDGVIDVTSSPVYALLERVTIHGDPSTHGYIKVSGRILSPL